MVEIEYIEENKTVYTENGKTITVVRECSENVDFSAVIDALIGIIEQEEKEKD